VGSVIRRFIGAKGIRQLANNENKKSGNSKRVMLYGGALLVIGGIATAWANASTEADILTLLSGAQAQLQLAYVIPKNDLEGEELTERANLIALANDQLERVDRIQPGMACTAEFRGFAHMLVDEFVEAASCYSIARKCADCDVESGAILAFNQARMLARAEKPAAALAVFDSSKGLIDQFYRHSRVLEQAEILAAVGRADDAVKLLDVLSMEDDVEPMVWIKAAQQYEDMGRFKAAEQALLRARMDLPIADYYLARLKLREGDSDIGIELLERASKAHPTEVRQLLLEEADAWAAVSENVRFQELSKPQPVAPGR
jgi:tetratricopeptide (TPR) repeat protein